MRRSRAAYYAGRCRWISTAPMVQTKLLATGSSGKLSIEGVLASTVEPVRGFLSKNAGERETKLFVDLGKQKGRTLSASDLAVLWPSFAITLRYRSPFA